jgi:hypothetical protein
MGQPIEMATGPPLFHACENVVKQPLRIEITENDIAKFEKAKGVKLPEEIKQFYTFCNV